MPATTHGFAEKVALIVNGGTGIGRAAALQLALQGCYVLVSHNLDDDGSQNSLIELKSLGTLADSFVYETPEILLDKVNNTFGRLDLLVICAEHEEEQKQLIPQICEQSVNLMKYRPKPAIVYVIRNSEHFTFPDNIPSHFRQNCVIPHTFRAESTNELFSVNNFDDVARVILFLLSSEAKAVNEQILHTT